MLVYLLRHGIAVARGTVAWPGDDRPLTDTGRVKMEKAARGIARVMDGVDLILTSPMRRAAETARIAADALGAEGKVEACDELAPGASFKGLMLQLAKRRRVRRVLLVGHEPDLGKIVSALLGASGSMIEFKKGALCCIDLDAVPPGPGVQGTLLWHLTPGQLRRVGGMA